MIHKKKPSFIPPRSMVLLLNSKVVISLILSILVLVFIPKTYFACTSCSLALIHLAQVCVCSVCSVQCVVCDVVLPIVVCVVIVIVVIAVVSVVYSHRRLILRHKFRSISLPQNSSNL